MGGRVKRTGSEAARALAKPDPHRAGILLHGPDAALVAMVRRDLAAALVGPGGEAELRLERIEAGDLRRDPARVADAIRARGFFSGPRIVVVEGASDAVAEPILDALAAFRPEDATLLVTAGPLPARSRLRKGFEAARDAVAVALYPDPPGRAEIAARLEREGIAGVTPGAMEALEALGAALEPGEFAQTLTTLALYRHGSAEPVDEAAVAAVAPAGPEAEIDAIVDAIAEGAVHAVGSLMRRVAPRAAAATGLVIGASRHFRALHAVAASPGGIEAGLAALRPPVFGARRARMAAQARAWGQGRAERAMRVLMDADLALRSSRPVPALALVERAFIRVAMMVRS